MKKSWWEAGDKVPEDFAELYSAATGIEVSGEDLRKGAERVYNLYKMLNVREGFGRAEDAAFPEVWLVPMETPDRREALTDYYRIRELGREDVLKLLDDYYDERGWDVERGDPHPGEARGARPGRPLRERAARTRHQEPFLIPRREKIPIPRNRRRGKPWTD